MVDAQLNGILSKNVRRQYAASRTATLAFVLFFAGSPSIADDLPPITELPPEQTSAAFARCAGLFGAMLRLGGAAASDTMVDHLERSILMNIAGASMGLINEGLAAPGEPANELASIVARAAADRYVERFHQNTATYGDPFGSDPVVVSDLRLCEHMTETLGSMEELRDL